MPTQLMTFSYELLATEQTPVGTARSGVFHTPHGVVETPMFMPVGTNSTVKSLTWDQIDAMGATMVLSNAFHMYLRPGHKLVAKAGGLHGWMNWQKPILTDSGGFQVFSLAKIRKIEEDGVRFQSPYDGSTHFIGPEKAMEIQNDLGADVIMAFDECPPYPSTYEYTKDSLAKTHRWLGRCFEAHARPHDQALFPIVQGGTYEDLRQESAQFVQQFNAHGYAIGGVSVGEPRVEINRIVAFTAPLLPENKPRYLMGVGTPEDILDAVARGIDLFDCVMPTRIGRHGTFFSPIGRKNIKNAEFREDFGPLVEGCECYTCQHHTRAYVRHLFKQKETTGLTLLSYHNVNYLIQTAKQARAAVLAGTFNELYNNLMSYLSKT